jgi:hypothetical protein
MFARTSRSFGPAVWISLCGMMSLFTNLSTMPALTVTDRDGLIGPALNCHE